MHSLLRLLLLAAPAFVISAAGPSLAGVVQDFSGPPAGTVVAGQEPNGGTAPGTTFPDFTLSVVNNGGGPNSLVIFDSSNPTGDDPDLGSPNETCRGGGPGIGEGGEVGQPGENCVAQGNLLIVAENIADAGGDNVVDDPDDEEGGGLVTFSFNGLVDPVDITIMDIDKETAHVTSVSGVLTLQVDASDLGNNSVQTLDLTGNAGVHTIRVFFSGSGAISEIEYNRPVSVEDHSWGSVKGFYR
jgi:hypothetical protein